MQLGHGSLIMQESSPGFFTQKQSSMSNKRGPAALCKLLKPLYLRHMLTVHQPKQITWPSPELE